MPAIKEVVEVEKTLTPEPVTKEVPKSDDVAAKKDEEVTEKEEVSESKDVVGSTETASEEQKPQDTEVTSSDSEPKEETSVAANGAAVADTEAEGVKQDVDAEGSKPESADSTANGSKVVVGEKEEASKSSEVDAQSIAPSEEPAKAEPESAVEVSTSAEKTPASQEDCVPKNDDTLSSVTDATEKAGEAEVKEEVNVVNGSETKKSQEPETLSSTEKVDTAGGGDVHESKEAPAVETIQESSDEKDAKSEATAKVEPLTTDSEKMETSESSPSSEVPATGEPNSKPSNSAVTGSDDVKPQAVDGDVQEEPKKEENTSADSTSEQKPAEAPQSSEAASETPSGTSSVAESESDVQAKIDELKKQGLAFFIQKDFCAAADSFGKLLEVQAPIYGEMSEKLAETYFLYGSAMYEYGKTENTVLGEKVPQKDEEEDDDEDEVEEAQEGAEEKMEVEETPAVNGKDEEPSTEAGSSLEEKQPADESLAEEDKEDDDAFRVAWEMLELAKATFEKGDNKKRLADTFMKLGELGIETGNPEAISEMVKGLNVRKELYKDSNNRIIPETHFTIGVAYAFFEKYDEAVEHFREAKKCLEARIESLSKSENKDDVAEIEEMKKILPEIQDKIQDTLESKADHEKLKEKQASENVAPEATSFPAASDSKPASNISHLVKRKRNVDDILPERAAKQIRQEDGKTESEVPSTTSADETSAAEKPAAEPEEKAVAPEENAAAPEEKTATPEDKAAAPEDESAAPEEKTAAPEETSAAPEEKSGASEAEPVAMESETTPAPQTEKETPEETKPHGVADTPAEPESTSPADKTEAATSEGRKEEEKMEVS